MTNKIEKILNICLSTRYAILTNKEKTILFRDFPYGCCRDASIIIGMRLEAVGIKNLKYCYREIDQDSPSHAWLEYKNLIIDITADQFEIGFPYVSIRETVSVKFYTKSKKVVFNPNIAGIDIINIFNDLKVLKKMF